MKAPSSDLFDLIQSLSAAEKRYYKLFVKQQKSTVNQVLFEYLNKQKNYDEEKVKAHFTKRDFVSNYAVLKNQLYQSILVSLERFHQKKNIEYELRTQLNMGQILMRKGLYQQAYKLINTTKKKALKFEHYDLATSCDLISFKLYGALNFAAFDADFIEEKTNETTHFLDVIKNLVDALSTIGKVNLLTRQYFKNDYNKFKKHLEEIVQQPFIKDKNLLSRRAAMNYYQTLRMYYEYSKSYEKSLEANIHLYNLAIEVLPLKQIPPIQYGIIIGNQAIALMQLKRYKEMLELLPRFINHVSVEYLKDSSSIFVHLHSYQHFVAENLGYKSVLVKLLKESGSLIKNHYQYLGAYQKSIVNIRMAISYFYVGYYNASTQYLQKILTNKMIPTQTRIFSFARCIHLIILSQIENDQNAFKSTYKNYHIKFKEETSFKESNIVIELFNHYLEFNSYKGILTELKEKLSVLYVDDNGYLEYFDLFSWVESIINNEPITNVIYKKNQNEFANLQPYFPYFDAFKKAMED